LQNEFARVIRSFSPQDVNTFVSLIHDTNPIHSDASFAAATRFKKPIVPGMLVSSLFSNLLGSKIAGTIYVSQQLRFVRPIYIDEVATAVVTISAIDRKFVTLDSRVYNHQQEIAVEGEAVVYIPSIRGAKN
jgi:3-hydroxybutyryl-CoA dehydratase